MNIPISPRYSALVRWDCSTWEYRMGAILEVCEEFYESGDDVGRKLVKAYRRNPEQTLVRLHKSPRYFGKIKTSVAQTGDHRAQVSNRVGATLQTAMMLEERLVTIEAQMVGIAREHPEVAGPFVPKHHNVGRELEDAARLASAAYPPEPAIEIEWTEGAIGIMRNTNP